MKKIFILGFLVVSLALAGQAGAVFYDLNFDELTPQDDVPANYKGLAWLGDWETHDTNQDVYPRYTPPIGILLNAGDNRINFGQTVNFLGSWIAGDNTYPLGYGNAYWEGYLGDTPVANSSIVYTDQATWSTADMLVDNIRLYAHMTNMGNPSWFFLIDNLRFDDLAPVPLPAGLVLLGTGLLALLGRKLRT